MKNKVIDITTFTGCDLKSRIAARELYDMILNQNITAVVIDFKNVSFATRSFIDEFYNLFFVKSDIHAELLHVSSEIQAMFDTVKSTQHRVKPIYKNRNSEKVIHFSSITEVNKFLSSLSFL